MKIVDVPTTLIPPPRGEVDARGLVRRASGGGTSSLRDAAARAARTFREAGMETPELDARLLLCHAAGLSHEAFVATPLGPLAPEAASRFDSFVAGRLAGEPVSRILGAREFYGRSFRIDAATLDPRPDTETVIEAALAIASAHGTRGGPFRLLDLGTGSGAILVTLLAELPHAEGVGTDLSPAALAIAKANAEAHGVADRASFVACDWLDAVQGGFDLIVSNPPYIPSAAIASLAAEVREQDPLMALDGGRDGLEAYRRIALSARRGLALGGTLLFEIGKGQEEAVSGILRMAGFTPHMKASVWRDLAGRPRAIAGQNPESPIEAGLSQEKKGAWKIPAFKLVSA